MCWVASATAHTRAAGCSVAAAALLVYGIPYIEAKDIGHARDVIFDSDRNAMDVLLTVVKEVGFTITSPITVCCCDSPLSIDREKVRRGSVPPCALLTAGRSLFGAATQWRYAGDICVYSMPWHKP